MAHTLAYLRIAGPVPETGARLATGAGGLTLRRAGFAPAGRHTKFHEGIMSSNSLRPALPGRTAFPIRDLHGLALNVTTFIESQTREQKYGMEHIAIDTDELDTLVEKLKAQGIHILEQTTIAGGRRVCFFEGPDGVQLECIEMKS
jgi:catechol 2,3-dioxygenase-like lactoylglutathione lyase family enzyme